MRQGCGRFKATANKIPVSMDKNRLSVSVFHGYNSIGMKRAFQALPTVNSERPNIQMRGASAPLFLWKNTIDNLAKKVYIEPVNIFQQ